MGAAAPALLSIATIPYIVAHLGATDFGLLMLVTSIVGYFALLDISVTAGSTKFVAEYNATGDRAQVHATASFGLAVYAGIGAVGMVALYVLADVLVAGIFDIPPERTATAVRAVQVASLGFLTGQVQAYLQSLPGALMRYDVSGRIEAGFGTLLPLLSVALLALGHGLVELVVLRVVMSVVQIGVLCWLLRGLLPGFRFAWPGPALRRQLLGFSAYAFLSRVAAITYAHADKLLIGARVGVAALAYYAVPTTLANRVMSLVFRLSGVMFPHASALAAAGRTDELRQHYLMASRYLFFVNGAIALTLAVLSGAILTLWLDAEFARQGARVMLMIALAQWVDSMTNLPSLVNDGLGHPRVTGLFALSRAVLGFGCISAGIAFAGIEGAAAGHLVASFLMTAAFLVHVHGRTVPATLGDLARQAYAMPLVALLPATVFMAWARPWIAHWGGLLAVVGCAAMLFVVLGWWLVVPAGHRLAIGRRLRALAST